METIPITLEFVGAAVSPGQGRSRAPFPVGCPRSDECSAECVWPGLRLPAKAGTVVLLEVSVEDVDVCLRVDVEVVLASEVHVVEDRVVETDLVAINSVLDVKTVDVFDADVVNVEVDKSVVNVAVEVVDVVFGQPRFL